MNASGIQSLFHRSARHTTHYLAAGPEDGPLLIFVHGWPELSRSWRHQLPAFAALFGADAGSRAPATAYVLRCNSAGPAGTRSARTNHDAWWLHKHASVRARKYQ